MLPQVGFEPGTSRLVTNRSQVRIPVKATFFFPLKKIDFFFFFYILWRKLQFLEKIEILIRCHILLLAISFKETISFAAQLSVVFSCRRERKLKGSGGVELSSLARMAGASWLLLEGRFSCKFPVMAAVIMALILNFTCFGRRRYALRWYLLLVPVDCTAKLRQRCHG